MDELEKRTFALMLTGLSQARRFGGDLNISPIMGENSAAHSLHSMVLATEMFRRAGLLSPQVQDDAVTEMRVRASLGLLTHDMGEILGELSSVAQRAATKGLEEQPDIEREIFRIALTEAFRATSASAPNLAAFYSFLRDMRHEAGIGQRGVVSHSSAALLATIRRYDEQQSTAPLPPEVQARIARYLELYDTAELKEHAADPGARFIGNAVKVIEHLQGLRHMVRFASTSPSDERLKLLFPDSTPSSPQGHWVKASAHEMVPLRYVSSYRISRNLWYMEKDLVHLSESAVTPNEQKLAATLREATYLSQAEYLCLVRPVFDRRVRSEDEFYLRLQADYFGEESAERRAHTLSIIQKFLEHRLQEDIRECRDVRAGSGHAPSGALESLETRRRLVGLYVHAARTGYVPTKETPLALLDVLPEALHGFDVQSIKSLRTASVGDPLERLSMPAVTPS